MKQYILIKSEGSYEDCYQYPILCSRDKNLIEQKKKEFESENNLNKQFFEKWRDKCEKDVDKIIDHMSDNDIDCDLVDYAKEHPEIISVPLDVFEKFSNLQDEWCLPDEINYYIRIVEEI